MAAHSNVSKLDHPPQRVSRGREGAFNVRHDASACVATLRRHSPREKACSAPTDSKRLQDEDAAWTEAMRKVQRGMLRDGSIPAHPVRQQPIRIFCMVYTFEARHELVAAIASTWGRECDGFMAASNATNASIGAVRLPHPGPEAYALMWQKVSFMWKFAHKVSASRFAP